MAVTRDDKGRLLPGSVMNPKGRPPLGLALSEISRRIVDKEAFVRLFLSIAQGQPLYTYVDPTGKVRVTDGDPPADAKAVSPILPTTAERLRAAEFLWDKIEPPTKSMALDVTTKDKRTAPDFSKMSPESLDRWLQLSMEMRKLTEGSGAIDVESIEAGNKTES